MTTDDELILRRLLWLRHNAEHFAGLYGDDGEMQCAACMLDFKRDAPGLIEHRFYDQALQGLAEGKLRCQHCDLPRSSHNWGDGGHEFVLRVARCTCDPNLLKAKGHALSCPTLNEAG